MNRLIPHPLLSLSLLFIWLLLNAFSLGHLLLGAAIALVAGWAFGAVEPQRMRVRNPAAMVRLVAMVTADIVRSNVAVAGLILTNGRHGRRRSDFLRIELRLRDPAALAVLAIILTATPGTAWLEFDPDTGILLLHVFDLKDTDEWQVLIRDRYEAQLLEIFV
ncbi:Na+/H+ antiporter subunit E [Neotabrizicola sp. VNH66]|uniref:Na+/H+ antiporter subunit E n=1 Tax=Neotabrizicola sp. VNH66 TaxID=3400918 RepID=UPI003C089EB5